MFPHSTPNMASSPAALANRPTPERHILRKDSRGRWRIEKDAYVEQLRRLGNAGSSRAPVPGTSVTVSKRLPLKTSFVGEMLVSPEELAVHHSYARGDGPRAAVLRRHTAELRAAMAAVVGHPGIADEDTFFDWIDSLVELDHADAD